MPSSDAFALQLSDLNRFLFADIGVEPNGTMLCLVSVFARLGSDPWTEAGRLARLPPDEATRSLASTIASMPASLWPLSEASTIAARLIALLPHGKPAAPRPTLPRFALPRLASAPKVSPKTTRIALVLACMALAGLSGLWVSQHSSVFVGGNDQIVSFDAIPKPVAPSR